MADGGERSEMSDRERALAVRRLRDEGMSLSAIGRALGVTRQAITKSLAREVPEAKPDVMASDLVRGRRGRRTQRAVTININRLSKREIERGRMEAPPAETTDLYDRPKTRGDCLAGGLNEARPCVWSACRHHLLLDVDENTGSIKMNFPPADDSAEALVAVLREMPDTCALDVADRLGITLEECGSRENLVRERVRQCEVDSLVRLKHRAPHLADYLDEDAASLSGVANALESRASVEAQTTTALDTLPRVVRVLPTPPPPAQERPTLDAEGRAIAALGMVRTNPRRIVTRGRP